MSATRYVGKRPTAGNQLSGALVLAESRNEVDYEKKRYEQDG